MRLPRGDLEVVSVSAPEPLSERHHLSTFDCGTPPLDAWLKTRALSNSQRGFTAVTVVHVDFQVIGYYGLAPTAVIPTVMPRSIRTGQPPNPVPCLLLGQLAVDRRWTGKGIGSGLLRHALERCAAAAHLIGGRAVVVHAVDDAAAVFWRANGFVPSNDDPMTLFQSMQSIVAALDRVGRI
ncbi:MAG: GNAT family N-acetyltransferase [Rhodospirillaceae bacterium]|nr:GNAT family N-acetyltransferase [Rhodospirillaceae bacterium]